MKSNLSLFLVLLPLFALSQSRETIDALAKKKVMSLAESWNLGISDSADMDIDVYNRYKLLFDSGATVQDDLNVLYEYTGYKKPGVYKTGGRQIGFDIYAHDIALAVLIRNMPFDPNSIVPVETSNPLSRVFRLQRKVEFQKTGRYVVPDTYAAAVTGSRKLEPKQDSSRRNELLAAGIKTSEDSAYKFSSDETLTVTMVYDKEQEDMVITSITTISNTVICTNDSDGDGIIDSQDSLPTTPGDFTANGRPDYDLDGIADADDKCPSTFGLPLNKGCPVEYFYTKFAFDVFTGGQLGAVNLALPETNQLGYTYPSSSGENAVDVSLSEKGRLKTPGLKLGFQAGGNFVFYFGQKKRQSGISAGISYARFTSGDYMLTSPMKYVFESSDSMNDRYRRQVTIKSLTEKITYNIINLPVMFNYRWLQNLPYIVILIVVRKSVFF